MSQAHPALREPWRSLHRQRQGASFGIWVFLASEVMFFAGALMVFGMLRLQHPAGFLAAARATDIWFGSVNTAVLLTSSLTIAVASQAAEAGLRRLALRCLGITALLGLAFLVVKGFEYRADILGGLVPGPTFRLEEPAAQLFFGFYWALTGVHAVHLTIGIVAVAGLAWRGWRGTLPLASPAFEVTALYWHLVDLVWVFLYPLLYLPGRSG